MALPLAALIVDDKGFAAAVEYFDTQLPKIIETIHEDDILVMTADHGNDPTDNSTDHSREYAPLLTFMKNGKKGVNLGIRKTFADAGKTVGEYFRVDHTLLSGTSFLNQIV